MFSANIKQAKNVHSYSIVITTGYDKYKRPYKSSVMRPIGAAS